MTAQTPRIRHPERNETVRTHKSHALGAIAAFLYALAAPWAAAAPLSLDAEFDLGRGRASEPRFYEMRTTSIQYEQDGARKPYHELRLLLRCTPGAEAVAYTCVRMTAARRGDAQAIPALAGWSYAFRPGQTGSGGTGEMFGIHQSKFQALADETGGALAPDLSYAVYNAFVDFHAICNVFAEPTEGGGIQDLKRVGDRIVHAAASSEPTVHLQGVTESGSTFRNGEITLALKGLSVVDGASCAIVAYDSGESSFAMAVEPAPGMNVDTVGSSHYFGDIYVDLASMWVAKAELSEFVVTDVTMDGQPLANSIVERSIEIRAVTKEALEELARAE